MKNISLEDLDIGVPVFTTERTVRLTVKSRGEYTPARRFYAIVGFAIVALLASMPVVHGAILLIGDIRGIV